MLDSTSLIFVDACLLMELYFILTLFECGNNCIIITSSPVAKYITVGSQECEPRLVREGGGSDFSGYTKSMRNTISLVGRVLEL